jgi:hypothetical protein
MSSMEMVPSYEVHLASDVISDRLHNKFLELGFVRDRFVGGTTGVVHPCHYTADPESPEAMEALWKTCLGLLEAASQDEFQGYGEAEITAAKHRIEIPFKPYDPSVAFPYGKFSYSECPLDGFKKFDIHITADMETIDPALQRFLEEDCYFHYVEIEKPTGKLVRVYTIQPFGSDVSADIWQPLVAFFTTCGGFEGKIKLEVCRYFERFPNSAACCPVITSVAPRSMALAA